MIICDICGKETQEEKKVRICYDCTNKAFQQKDFHMCGYCQAELIKEKRQAEVDFYTSKMAKAPN
jgi:hypothetical protein